jgi:hypothetical protein
LSDFDTGYGTVLSHEHPPYRKFCSPKYEETAKLIEAESSGIS